MEIPAILKSVVADLEGPEMEKRIAMAKQIFNMT